jgi:hypothetical protein
LKPLRLALHRLPAVEVGGAAKEHANLLRRVMRLVVPACCLELGNDVTTARVGFVSHERDPGESSTRDKAYPNQRKGGRPTERHGSRAIAFSRSWAGHVETNQSRDRKGAVFVSGMATTPSRSRL